MPSAGCTPMMAYGAGWLRPHGRASARDSPSSAWFDGSSTIPPKANRKAPATFDKELYQARSAVECTLNLLKQARRFATRYEKTLRNYSAVVAIGCALLWLRI